VLVHFSSHFRSYTGGREVVEAQGATLSEVFRDLDRRFPGLRFRAIDEHDRVRRHVKVYLNLDAIEDLTLPVRPADEMHVLGALSGG
jgi:molybdopterin converting factor small subunit